MNNSKPDTWSRDLFASIDSDDFACLLDVDRYGSRSSAFDRFVAQTHAHFWDPADRSYIDFEQPFDMDRQTVLPMPLVPELHSAVADRLSEPERIRFANECARWWLSSLLHGEQGALSLSASLCQLLSDPGAVEFAANQAREEARHVNAFSRYIERRWGKAYPASVALRALLGDLVASRDVHKKMVGMQLLVEGLAMGIFSAFHRRSNDPVLKRLTQLVMVDEAFHHHAGRVWSRHVLPDMTQMQRDEVEDWALSCFQAVISNLMHPQQKQVVYASFGLEWEWVRDAMREAYANKDTRAQLADANSMFNPLVRTLLQAEVITKRTRHFYAVWADLKELGQQSDDQSSDAVVAEGLEYLSRINSARRDAGLR